MRLFHHMLQKKSKQPPLPSLEEIVEALYDQDLDGFAHEVVEVLYSKDRSKRYIILKSKSGFYTYLLEGVCIWDEDEWQNIPSHENVIPGWWETIERNNEKSFFGTMEELKKDLHAESEYRQHFSLPHPSPHFESSTLLPEECYCPYLQKIVEEDLCYDMQMIAGGYVKPDVLPEVEIDKTVLLVHCNQCNRCF